MRTITADYDGDGINDGIASGMPTFQGRIGAKFGLGANASLQLGFSAHYGESKGLVNYTTDSINVDCLLAFAKFKIVAEYFQGKNLGAFLGGIVQNINTITNREIEAKGYFVNAQAALSPKLSFSFGYGMDDPDDATLLAGMRAKNTTLFGNFVVKLSPSLKIGLEISNWITDYFNTAQQKSLRFQNSWIFTF